MPLSDKGNKIMAAMEAQYGKKKGKRVFYASKNKGKIKGVEKASKSTSRLSTKKAGKLKKKSPGGKKSSKQVMEGAD